ncbi:MAG: hypothetical protein H0T76_04785 [Nannocystis sp.]|nr:hypothetical protein [Nannocystis sp.]MBA3545780.1 hypothetical protein [Nannocystis sp.]
MITIARAAQASALFFDSERDDEWELLPQAKHVPQPPEEIDPDRPESADEYCKQALELAGLT